MRPIWPIAAGAAAGVVGLGVYVSTWHEPHAALASMADARIVAWCAAGLEPIEGEGCFAAPPKHDGPVTLVVYLHGRYVDAADELDRQARVARGANKRGLAVLAVRGARGECNAPGLADYWCWPSNERNADDGPAFVAGFDAALAAARARLGPGSNVLFGFSNGGYFAALIAARALAPFDAVAIAHGGPVEPVVARPKQAPMLLITADDAADPEMRKLDAELGGVSWPHALIARDGGHALPDWDIDAAMTFFDRVVREGFPLVPPIASRVARPSVSDAGGEVASDGHDDLRDL